MYLRKPIECDSSLDVLIFPCKEMATHSSVLAWRIPGTGGAWWAAIYGVTQSWTQLKRLSSSSSSKSLMERSAPHSSNLLVTSNSLLPKCVLDCTYHIHQNHICMTPPPLPLQSSSSELRGCLLAIVLILLQIKLNSKLSN